MPGYSVVNFNHSWQPAMAWTLSASVSNLFDRSYAPVGQLGPFFFARDRAFRNSDSAGTSFFAPGAPRAVSIHLRHAF